jgi:hypothetical protein
MLILSIIWQKKMVVLSTLIHHAQTICDNSLQEEIQHLKQTFKKNGYSSWDIQQDLHVKNKPETATEKPTGVT